MVLTGSASLHLHQFALRYLMARRRLGIISKDADHLIFSAE